MSRRKTAAEQLDAQLNDSLTGEPDFEEQAWRNQREAQARAEEEQAEDRVEQIRRELDYRAAGQRNGDGGTKSKRRGKSVPAVRDGVFSPAPGNGTMNLHGALDDPSRADEPPAKREHDATVPTDAIHRAPHKNPRKQFDQAKLEELAQSIRTQGILQPLLVRPLYRLRAPHGLGASIAVDTYWRDPARWNMAFELVAGERRLRAAMLAGLNAVPVKILDLSDREATEIRLIENDQREDLLPMERARAYYDMTCNGWSVEQLAERLGRAKTYVYQLCKLAKHLPESVGEAVDKGELPVTTAQLIARVPAERERCKFARQVLTGERGEPLSYRMALRVLQEDYMVELKKAPFKTGDTDLLPGVGACTVCPKRAGNNPDEYADTRADICTDPTCFKQKVKAYADQRIAAAKREGREVLTGSKAKKLFASWDVGRLDYQAPYEDLDDTEYISGKGSVKWRQIVGKERAEKAVLAVDPKGNLHELLPKSTCHEALRQANKAKNKTGRVVNTYDQQRRKEIAAHKPLLAELLERARAAGEAMDRAHDDVFQDGTAFERLKAITLGFLDNLWHDAKQRLLKVRNVQPDTKWTIADLVKEQTTAGGLFGLLSQGLAASLFLDPNSTHHMDPLQRTYLEAFDLDLKTIKAAAKAKA